MKPLSNFLLPNALSLNLLEPGESGAVSNNRVRHPADILAAPHCHKITIRLRDTELNILRIEFHGSRIG